MCEQKQSAGAFVGTLFPHSCVLKSQTVFLLLTDGWKHEQEKGRLVSDRYYLVPETICLKIVYMTCESSVAGR